MWEEKKKFLFLPYYRYSKWADPKPIVKSRLWKISRKSARVVKMTPLPEVVVGKKEFEERYSSNKWLVPINRKLGPTIN